MQLLDRYLQAIKFWLPKSQQDDIVAELSEDIRSQIEEREHELGRKLNQAELEFILKQRGRPFLVANRYLPQQYLIGPVLFPVYKFVLKIVALCYLVPWLLVWVGFRVFDPRYRATHTISGDLLGAWGSLWMTAFLVIGTVTAIFAGLERAQSKSKFLENWNPAKLPPVRDARQIPRYVSVLGVVANLVFLTWWLNGKWSLIVFEHSGVRITLTTAWQFFFWSILLFSVLNVPFFVVSFFRPYWTVLRASIQLAFDFAGATIFCLFLNSRILVEIVAPNLSPERAARIVNAINTNMSRALPFVAIACALAIGLTDVGRIIRLRAGRTRPAQDLGAAAHHLS